jgi:tetratricopeptide (TPR) repeat protein
LNRSAAVLAGALALLLALPGGVRAAEPRTAPGGGSLGQKKSVGPDAALEGTLEVAKKTDQGPAGPKLAFEQFRSGIEVKLSGKRREEIQSLQKLIKLSAGDGDKDLPGYYFRLAEMLWEESQYFFFEANRKEGEVIALPRGDARIPRLQAERAEDDRQYRSLQKQAVALYRAIIKKYPKYERLDEVLFFLARNLLQRDRADEDAMKAYRALIKNFPGSPYVPDAWMAFGEYYFDRANRADRTGNLRKALEAYQKAASYQESSVYGYALYKQGWVQFNLGNFAAALDLFRAVVFFGELPTSSIPADRKLALVKEAKKDYVRTWPHVGSPEAAFEDFKRVGGEAGARDMIRTLGDIYWTDGMDRESILVYHKLIRQDPVAVDAPFLQSRIVTMAGRMGKKEVAVQQAHVFVKILEDFEVSPRGKDPANAKLTGEARSTAENTLRYLALRYHNEWKKTDDQAVAGFAISVYADYLEVFGGGPSAYEMRFFHAELLYALGRFAEAGEEYDRVVVLDVAAMEGKSKQARGGESGVKAGKWFNDALEGSLFAHEEAVKALPPLPAPPAGPKKRLAMAPQRLKLAEAYQRYARWRPDGKLASKAAYRGAKLSYDHYDYAEAIDLFTRVALDHSTTEEAEYATNLVLDAYNELGDWRNLNGWAKRFFANQVLLNAHPKLRDDLPKVIEQSAFKIIEEQEKAREWEAAAESYLAFVHDWPTTRLAPTALYNASVDYARASRADKSMEVRDQLLQRFPGDALAPRCLFENAAGYESIADFQRAADAYERYFREWRRTRGSAPIKAPVKAPARRNAKALAAAATVATPAAAPVYEEKKAIDAIINAAVFRAGLRDWSRAEAASQAYLEVWPEGEDAARLSLSLADVAARQGPPQKELKRLEEYQRRYARTPDEWLAAQQRIARVMEKSGNAVGTRTAYEQGLEYWKRNREKVKDKGLPVAAEGMFRALEPSWTEYQKLNLNIPQRELEFQLKKMAGRLKKLEEEYTAVVKLGVAAPAVCSLERIGMLYRHFGRVLLEAPVPKEIKNDKDLVEVYKSQLAEQAEPLETKAQDGFELAATKARELGVRNDCANRSMQVAMQKRPELGPTQEALPVLAAAPSTEHAAGYGLLAALEAAAPAAKRGPTPARGAGVAPAPPLKPPPVKGTPRPDARGKEKTPPSPPASDDPPPRPKRGEDEDLLQ